MTIFAGSPFVNVREIDASTRVPGFPGVAAGIVIPALKGKTEEIQLVTSDIDFLNKYTPNGRIEVGYDNSYYSALAYLQKSDKLYVTRAHNGSIFGGAFITTLNANIDNEAFAIGIRDNSTFEFESSEETDVSFVITGSNQGDWNNNISIKIYNYHPDETLIPSKISGSTITVDPTTGNGAKWVTGEKVRLIATTESTVPGGLVNGTVYYVIRMTDTTIKLATTLARALAGTSISLSTIGSGSFVLSSADGKVKEANTFVIDVFRTVDGVSSLVETWKCSKTPGTKDLNGINIYIQDVLEGSSYISAVDNVLVTDVYPTAQPSELFLAGGDDGDQVIDGQMITALDLFQNEDIPVTLIMDGGWATAAYHSEIVSVCEGRQDCFGILSTPYSEEASTDYLNELIKWRKIDDNINSSYVAMYTPHVKIYDKYTDRNLYVPPDGYIAAIISETGANYEIWYPPAGFKRGVVRVLDVRRRFKKSEMDLLNENQVNYLRFVNGKGIIVWDQLTMYAAPSDLQDVNVRLLLITIEPAIKVTLENFLFEINDEATRALIRSILTSYLDSIKARRGISDYVLVCDDTNNTAEDIDNYRLNVTLAIKPVKAVKYIDFAVIITRQGIDFSTALASV
jgi:hypothetical protein